MAGIFNMCDDKPDDDDRVANGMTVEEYLNYLFGDTEDEPWKPEE